MSNPAGDLMSTPNPIRIVLAADHAMMSDGLRSLIRKEENMRSVEELTKYAIRTGLTSLD
jgi:DNA-binding NarL/FixJ family response regulator